MKLGSFRNLGGSKCLTQRREGAKEQERDSARNKDYGGQGKHNEWQVHCADKAPEDWRTPQRKRHAANMTF